MGSLYDLLNKPKKGWELSNYIKEYSKSMDIENLKTMVNTFAPEANFSSVDKLIQYCIDNKISYFKRGEYDIFTLAEVEELFKLLNTKGSLNEVYQCFGNKYPKRTSNLTYKQFKDKLEKLKFIENGKEMKTYMRYTNDVVEYVRHLGKEHTMEESLPQVQKYYPNLYMTLDKLKEMSDRYIIKFVANDTGFFRKDEADDIKRISQTCSGIKELYDIFNKAHPNRCNYLTFIQELNKLNIISAFSVDKDKFSLLEEAYITELMKTETDNASLYAMFNKVFPNVYPYMQFITRLNELKVATTPKSAKKEVKDTSWSDARKDPKVTALVDYVTNSKEMHTINEWLEVVNNDDRFMNYTYKGLYNLFARYNLPYNKEVIRGKVQEASKSDIELIRKYSDMGYSVAKIKEAVDKETDTFRDIKEAAFRLKMQKYGVELKAQKGKYDRTHLMKPKEDKPKERVKHGGRRSIYMDIYNDAVTTIEGSTLKSALAELQEKHPDIADMMTMVNITNFAKNHKLNFRRETREEMLERMKETRAKKADKNKPVKRGNKGVAEEAYELLKGISKEHTRTECIDIINNKFGTNFPVSYISTLMGRRGKLEFKQYDKFTPEMESVIKELQKTISNKHDLYKEFANHFQGAFNSHDFFKCLDIMETENSKIIIHNLDGTKPSIKIVPKEEPKQEQKVIEWHKEPEINEEDFVEPTQQIMPEYVESIQHNLDDSVKEAIEEVNVVYQEACKRTGKQGDARTHLTEILNALILLLRYCTEKDSIERLINDHIDMLDRYRTEVFHEIENRPYTDTDTYCQNKLKAISEIRRDVKYLGEDLRLLQPILNVIGANKDVIEKGIANLKKAEDFREHPVFTPIVDIKMVDKYDWAVRGSITSRSANVSIFKTNLKNDKIRRIRAQGGKSNYIEVNPIREKTKSKEEHRISTYRIKAEYLTLKGKPFVARYYEVQATNEDLAKEKAIEHFDAISKENGNAKYSIKFVNRLNV